MTSEQIWEIFQDEYLPASVDEDKWGRYELLSTRTASELTGSVTLDIRLRVGDEIEDRARHRQRPDRRVPRDHGDAGSRDPALRLRRARASSASGDALAAAYVELQVGDKRLWGVGIDADISTASLKAVVSAVNRAVRTESGDRELVTV